MIQQWRGVPVGTSIFSRWSDKKNGASWVDGGEEVCLPLSSTGGPAGNEIRQRQPLHRERYPRVIPKFPKYPKVTSYHVVGSTGGKVCPLYTLIKLI